MACVHSAIFNIVRVVVYVSAVGDGFERVPFVTLSPSASLQRLKPSSCHAGRGIHFGRCCCSCVRDSSRARSSESSVIVVLADMETVRLEASA